MGHIHLTAGTFPAGPVAGQATTIWREEGDAGSGNKTAAGSPGNRSRPGERGSAGPAQPDKVPRPGKAKPIPAATQYRKLAAVCAAGQTKGGQHTTGTAVKWTTSLSAHQRDTMPTPAIARPRRQNPRRTYAAAHEEAARNPAANPPLS